MNTSFKKNIFLSLFTLFVFFSCKPEGSDIDIPKTSSVEKLIEHSDEFEKSVLTYETPGGKIHFAIGFGIANSIMVEGENGNVIIDASDSTFEASEIYKRFQKLNNNPIVAKKISSSLATSGLTSRRKYNIITDDPKIKPNKTFGLKTKFNIISFLRFIRLFKIFESEFLRYLKF